MSAKDEYGLLPKQRLFADLYLSGLFAAEALRQAGYGDADAGKAASRLLRRKPVQAYLKAERARLAEKLGLRREEILEWLQRVILTPVSVAREQRELLEAERVRKFPGGRTGYRVRMVNKMAAVRQLCAMMGWNKPEKEEVTVFGVTQSELGEMIRKQRERGAQAISKQSTEKGNRKTDKGDAK